jgi:hypothetical protein
LPRKPDDSVANVAESEASARFDRFRFMSFSQQDRWIVTKKLRNPVDGYDGVEEGGRVHGRSSANYRSLGAKISGEERHYPNYGAGCGDAASHRIQSTDDAEPLPRFRFPEEFEHMNKAIIVSLAILGLSTSAALAKTHHAKKPDAAPAASTYPAETHIFHVSDADKALYAKNKREAGMK